ncbi:MAG: toxin-antitoxin system YwqK family antitoxin [Saprospiraceae bacterium]
MRKYGLWALMALTLASCKPKTETVETKDEAGNTIRYERRLNDYAKEGTYLKLNPNGKKLEEAQYKNDTLNGWRILYSENGDTSVAESYKNGAFDGAYRVFHENGKLKLVGQYANNEMMGVWKGYYDNGALKEEVHFEKNQENGPFVEYHPNGKLKAEGTYLNGDFEHGELKLYNENGELVRRMNCDKGVCKTVWSAEGDGETD